MPSSLLVATRKGLFQFRRRGKGNWIAREPAFLGVPVSATLHDPRDGTVYAALDHGHFGTKLHRRGGDGKWEEVATPKYPPRAKGTKTEDAFGRPLSSTLKMIWILEVDPRREGSLWCGTAGRTLQPRSRRDVWSCAASEPASLLVQRRVQRQACTASSSIRVPQRHSRRRVRRRVATAASDESEGARDAPGPAAPEGVRPTSQDVHRVVQCRAASDPLGAAPQRHLQNQRRASGRRSGEGAEPLQLRLRHRPQRPRSPGSFRR